MFLPYFVLDILTGFFCFVFGTTIGSFINVVVDRLIKDESLGGRSHCDYCKKTLQWLDLIPVLSFLIQKGRCRYCHRRLSFQYPLVETGTGVLYVITWLLLPLGHSILHLVLYWGIVSAAWIIFISDLKYQLISDYIQIILLFFILLLKIIENATFFSLFIDIASGFGVLFPIALIFLLSRGKAMGEGDIILAFSIGFLLGIVNGLLALYIAFLCGAGIGIILLVMKKKKMKSKIAFGPFLIVGMASASIWGGLIITYIKKLYGF